MGKFIWHQWAAFVAIFACIYTTWAGFWGIFYRKFFWDFVDGTLVPNPNILNPNTTIICDIDIKCGIQPSKSAAPFVLLIVQIPLIQIAAMVFALFYLALVLVPALSQTSIHRSLVFRAVLLYIQAFLAILFYQGTNGALYATTAAVGYTVGIIKGEEMEAAKDNRGRQERA